MYACVYIYETSKNTYRFQVFMEESSIYISQSNTYIVIPSKWKGFPSNVAVNIQNPTIVIVVANSRLLLISDLLFFVYWWVSEHREHIFARGWVHRILLGRHIGGWFSVRRGGLGPVLSIGVAISGERWWWLIRLLRVFLRQHGHVCSVFGFLIFGWWKRWLFLF